MAAELRVNLRVSAEQKEAWEAAAKLAKRKLSDWARISLDSVAADQNEAVGPERRPARMRKGNG